MRIVMKSVAVIAVIVFTCASTAWSQQLVGLVIRKDERGVDEAVAGANVRWLNTTNGVATGENGIFMIDRISAQQKLVISYIGYKPDTLTITDQTNVKVELKSVEELKEIT